MVKEFKGQERRIHPDFAGLSPTSAVLAAVGNGLMDPQSTAQLLSLALSRGPHGGATELRDSFAELPPVGDIDSDYDPQL